MFQPSTRLIHNSEGLCEDAFAHRYLDGLLDGIFATSSLVETQWANIWLSAS
ncbi:hypothetical protein DM01DRAFT_1069722 [Hesseltinella vesiculosa]|uniref:Uncharacterized protein n=1 Tax=Hesseltinella vesiculosa TaxID=101127 RepID=A0A1X2GVC0_9FUNG|nr:hypothetical protein DM01DRAFT_1069722 [Hesseltinella vesiculosa]